MKFMCVELGRDEKIVLSITLAVMISLASLFAYMSLITPKRVGLSEIESNVGNFVEVSGVVGEVRQTQRGEILKIYDETFKNRTEVYLMFHESLYPGESVVLRGVISRYRGVVEILVSSESDLKILHKYLNLNIKELLANSQFFVGMKVRLRGDLSVMRPSHYIEVSDGFNFTKIYTSSPYFGERNIYVHGKYKHGMIYADNITLNYTGPCVSMGKLDNYEGKEIWIHGTVVSYFYYGYLIDGGYTLKVVADRIIGSGEVVVEGKFVYTDYSGQYELVVE